MQAFAFLSFICLLATCAVGVPSSQQTDFSLSGNWVGNGGVVVACAEDEVIQYTALDILDENGMPEMPDIPQREVLEKVLGLIARIEAFDSHRAALYKSLAYAFADHIHFENELPKSNDFGILEFLPDFCEPLQAVIQIASGHPASVKYHIDRGIWEKLDEDTKAILMLHEILYFEADLMGHRNNSFFVRQYVKAIVLNSIASDQKTYFRFMKSINLGKRHWIDPLTLKKWTFLASFDTSGNMVEKACRYLEKGRMPTLSEFRAARSRIFNSDAALSLWEGNPSLFWTRDDKHGERQILVTSEGQLFPATLPGDGLIRNGICIES